MQVQAELDAELESFRGSEESIKKLEKKYKQGAREIEVTITVLFASQG
jgi:hypothetical protein